MNTIRKAGASRLRRFLHFGGRKGCVVFLYLFSLLLLFASSASSQTIWFVDSSSGNDNNTGGSWSQAYATLTKALASSASGNEIWVARGIYKPGPGTVATETFTLKPGVRLYGGFAGTESSLPERTNWEGNATVLDGSNKSYHVLTGSNLTNSTILDGFTVTGGNAVFNATASTAQNHGGGIYLTGAAPILRNLIIRGNKANFYGAGIANNGANLVLEDVSFSENRSMYSTAALGGAMYNTGAAAQLTRVSFNSNVSVGNGGGLYNTGAGLILTDVNFTGNQAVSGGGLWNSAVATLNRASFIANVSSSHGGGMYNAGSPQLNNVVFSRNLTTTVSTSAYGAGVYTTSGIITLVNTTFSNNRTAYVHASTLTGAGLYRNSGTVNIYNSIFWGNKRGGSVADQLNAGITAVNNTIVEGGYASGNALNLDPQFVNAAADDLRLKPASAAIDAGNVTYLNFTDQDLSGNARIVNNAPDLGAYERGEAGTSFIYEGLPASLVRGQPINLQLSTNIGSASRTWSISSGALPAGLVLSSSGRISGTPFTHGDYSFVVRASDGSAFTDRWYSGIITDAAARFYVSSSASGATNGNSWTNAFKNLQNALAMAKSGDEIWVAKGTYSPGPDAASSYTLISDVKIYGGFAGTESLLSDRDQSKLHTLNETILDGGNINSHVVYNAAALGSATLLDGFTISKGNAVTAASYGGGIYNTGGSATFKNLVIRNNQAVRGGGMYNTGTSILEKVTFLNNSSTAYGGGLWNTGLANLTDVVFRANTAGTLGGAMYNTASTVLNRVSFIANSSVQHGGGLYTATGSPRLDNVIFSRNNVSSTAAHYGGGLYNHSGTVALSNATFSHNSISHPGVSGTSNGGAIHSVGTTNLYNSILWGNTRGNALADQINVSTVNTIEHTIVQDGYEGTRGSNIFLGDPLFRNAAADDLTLTGGSIAIDAGDNSKTTTTEDFNSDPRIINSRVDLGAYEVAVNTGILIQTADQSAIPRGTAFSLSFSATGGTNNYTWSVSAGTLPPGLLFSTTGVLSGIPLVQGTFDFVIRVSDGALTGSRQYRVVVNGEPARIYVSERAGGANNGTSWANAFNDLQNALAIAKTGDEIWVSKGTYSPGTTVMSTFTMVSGVKIYGGFAGIETDLTQRNSGLLHTINETVLTGNHINYHVVFNNLVLDNTTLLDGFTITGGKTADGTAYGLTLNGSGIYNGASVSAEFKNLVIRDNWSLGGSAIYNLGPAQFSNLRILDNTAKYDGAGILNSSAAASFSDITFTNNIALRNGGAVYNSAAATFSNSVFTGNTAVLGGGIYTTVAATFQDLTFSGNIAVTSGGGLYNIGSSVLSRISFLQNKAAADGGGMYNQSGNPVITDVSFRENNATARGGGFYAAGAPVLNRVKFILNTSVQHGGGLLSTSTVRMDNVIFSRNSVTGLTAISFGGGMYSSGGVPVIANTTFSNNSTAYIHTSNAAGAGLYRAGGTVNIHNSIFWGNSRGENVPDQLGGTTTSINVTHTIVQDGFEGTNVYLGDPLFVNAAADDLKLKSGSLAIDAGDNSKSTFAEDMDGNARIINNLVDLGAYEALTNHSIQILTADPDAVLRGQNYSLMFSASGGTVWSLAGGSLPQGLVFSNTGTISGIPLVSGTYDFVVSVTDGLLVGNRQYRLVVDEGPSRIYVNHAAGGNRNGISWQHALTDLQQALAIAQSGDEIWVAKGTYSPGNTVSSTFNLVSGVKIYGGFSGTETELSGRLEANIRTANETILDGANTNYHVVTGSGVLTNATLLDGFTISGGKTLGGTTGANYSGAGIYNNSTTVAAVFNNLLIRNNSAAYGGGIFNSGPATFSTILFRDNIASVDGGGLHNSGAAILNKVEFSGNSATGSGGGMYTSAAVTLTDMVFTSNTATANGGGLWNAGISTLSGGTFSDNRAAAGGGMYNSSGNSVLSNINFTNNISSAAGGGLHIGGGPSLTDVRFTGNSAGTTGGGGIYSNGTPVMNRVSFISNTAVQNGGGLYIRGTTRIENAIISDNKVTGSYMGGGIYHYAGTSTIVNATFSRNGTAHASVSGGGLHFRVNGMVSIYNSIFWGNTRASGTVSDQVSPGITIANSIVEGGYPTGTSILIGDPLFVNAAAHDLQIGSGSPAINAGDNAYSTSITDIGGELRIHDDVVDLGAYENQGSGESLKIVQTGFATQTRGTAINEQLTATGGTSNYTWSISSGSLPQGMILSKQGLLTGTPVLSGSSTFVISVSDGTLVGNRQFTMQVNPGTARLYVRQFAAGKNSGANWQNALTTMTAATAISQAGDEIWVAKGTYTPGTLVSSSFNLKEGVKWYGGFAATENTLAERDTSKIRTENESILSGNNKSYHVVFNNVALSNATVLDGFTISGGKALAGSTTANYLGGGIYNSVATVSAVFQNLLIKNNAASYGGGIYNLGSGTFSNILFMDNTVSNEGGGMYTTGSPSLTDLGFYRNISTGNGGGLWNSGAAQMSGLTFNANKGGNGGGLFNSAGNPVLTGAVFTSNISTAAGGGMYIIGNPSLSLVQFISNTAITTGGGLYNTGAGTLERVSFIANSSVQNGGGMWSSSSPKLDNIVFSRNKVSGNNTSGYGGAFYNSSGNPVLTNISFGHNSIAYINASTTSYGGALYRASGTVTVNNSIFWGNTRGNAVADQIGANVTVFNSIIQDGYAAGTNVMIGNPLFQDAAADNLRLKSGSIAINAGDNAKLTKDKDMDGNPRLVDDQVDLGAYENQGGGGLSVQPSVIAGQVRGTEVSLQLQASGGTGDYIWTLQSGTLPVGLSISSSGLLSGRPMVTGTYTFVLTASDGALLGNKQYTVQVAAGNTRMYTNVSATGANNGSSWANAFTDLQTAIAQSVSGDEIWVAKGVYSPGATVTSWFALKEGVKWYGGFAGTEGSPAERDLSKLHTLNETRLSGNNLSYHVIYNTAVLTAATVVDGFSITDGKTAAGTTGTSYYGGGLYNSTGSPVLSNLVFRNNAGYYGGAIYNTGSPALTNIVFTGNTAGVQGGAIYNTGAPSLNNVTFNANASASSGGAVFNTGSPIFDRASFNENTSVASGAAVYHSGGTLQFTNTVFSNNRVSSTGNYAGAGLYHNAGTTILSNVSFSNNKTSYVHASTVNSYGAALFFKAGSVNVYNSIFWGNTRGNNVPDQLNAGSFVFNSIVQNGYAAGTNILIGDPLFEDALNNNLRLKAGSGAIDAGDNARSTTATDLAGNERIINDVIDLGALENSGGGSLAVRPLTIPTMVRGDSEGLQLIATGGNGNYTWTLQSGTLPTGITLTAGGLLSSAATLTGTYTFVVAVTDGDLRGSRQYTVQVTEGAARLYVNASATGSNTGSDWQNAFTDLQTALAQSASGDEIWVAKGVYSPGLKVSSYFTLKEGVRLYGGFAATESSLSEREISKLRTDNETILDGSQGVASYHVVYNAAALSNATVLDGFTISGGRTASGNSGASYNGAGIYNSAGQAVFRNLWVKNNIAYYYGGGMYNLGASELRNIIFQDNATSVHGAGLYNTAAAKLTNISFINNHALQYGGGMFNSGLATLDSVSFNGNKSGTNGGGLYTNAALNLNDISFISNTAAGSGGGLWSGAALALNRAVFEGNSSIQNGGGMFNSGASNLDRISFISNTSGYNGAALYNSGSSVLITNSVFSRNTVSSKSGYYGAAIYAMTGNLTLSNNTFSNNRIGYVNSGKASYGAALYYKSGTVNAYNSIFWGNTRGNNVPDQLNAGINVVNALIQGGYDAGVNIFIGNPEFEDAAADNLQLKAGSAALESGDNTKNIAALDLAGNPRISNDIIDLGAYEHTGAGSLIIQPGTLAILKRGTRVDQQFIISEIAGTNVWTLQSGILPAGLTFNSSGLLSGTPTVSGIYTFVLAVDNGISKGSRQFKVQVNNGALKLHVYAAATGLNSGSDWTHAFTDLKTALAQAESGDELWVAKGTYSPGNTVSSYFTLKEGVKWFGGFGATESSLADRDTSLIRTTNETILDGSQGVPSYHVLYNTAPLTQATVIDGFTVSGAKTVVNGSNHTYASYSGAGLYNDHTSNSLVVRNMVFRGNRASNGGAIYTSGTPSFTNIWLQGNVADFRGGAIYNAGAAVFEKLVISGNTAQTGAGLYNLGASVLNNSLVNGNNSSVSGGGIYTSGGSMIIDNVSFIGNSATGHGGGMYSNSGSQRLSDLVFRDNTAGGSAAGLHINSGSAVLDRVSFISNTSVQNGAALYNGSATTDINNSVFTKNKVSSKAGYYGGAAYNYSGILTFNNTTFSNNSINYVNASKTVSYGGALYRRAGTVNLYNSILWDNTRGNGVADQLNASINTASSIIQKGYAGTPGIIDADPWFKDAANDDLSLLNGSIGIDLGDNNKNINPKDIEGKPRVTNSIIDIGAYESPVGSALDIQPVTLPVLVRGSEISIQLTATPSEEVIVWGIASGALPTGLVLSPDGKIQGAPVVPGVYDFIIKSSDSSLRGTRQYSIQVSEGPARLYVDARAKGSNNGSDWANAFTDFQTAISQSVSGDEIWVAKGAYSPGLKATSYFTLKEGVKWYGGFAGTETSHSERDAGLLSSTNETILDGSQGIASYHVIYNTALLSSATLVDGFTISGGKTIISSSNYLSASYVGAGLYDGHAGSTALMSNLVFRNNRASSGGAIYSTGSLTFNNIRVEANTAAFNGGGIYTSGAANFTNLRVTGNSAANGGGWFTTGGSKLTIGEFNGNTASTTGGGIYTSGLAFDLDSVRFINNTAVQYGAGLYASRGILSFTDILFRENKANQRGGALYINSGTGSSLDRLTFIGNTAAHYGGAFYNGGAGLSISNSIFSRNSLTATGSYYGGAIYTYSGILSLSNNTFSNNSIKYVNASTTLSYGGAVYRRSGTVNINNSILWGNTRGNGVSDQLNAGINVLNSLIKGGYANGTLVVIQDPQFTNASTDDLSLLGCSPAINLGDNTSSLTTEDNSRNARIASGTVDIGALEYQGTRLEITPASLPNGIRGTLYSQQFSASGGTGNYTYEVTYGQLPDGLSLSSSGLLIGNPIVGGTYLFNVAVSDGTLCGNMVYEMEITAGSGVVRIYVNEAATAGMNNGSGWDNAYLDLQRALNVSFEDDEIWVAKGTYSPGVLAASRFTLKPGVKIYGGFAGIETALAQRDTSLLRTVNETILDGSKGAASYHVVYNTAPLSSTTVLDGFTITGGRSTASGSVNSNFYGAGFYNTAGSPLLENLVFRNNSGYLGVGMYNSSGSPVLNNVLFRNNTATNSGGAIYSTGTTSQIVLNKVSFIDNSSVAHGGAAYFRGGTSSLTDVYFSGNKVTGNYYGGALFNSSPMVLNRGTFINNSAYYGGAIYTSGAPLLTEVQFKNNQARAYGGAVYLSGSPVMNKVSFIANTAIYHGGAIYQSGTITINNSFFSRNSVTTAAGYYGGAIYHSSGTLNLLNTSFSNNRISYVNSSATVKYGAAVHRRTGTVNVNNSIFWGNTRGNNVYDQLNASMKVNNAIIQNGYATGEVILTVDPQFTDAASDDLSLLSCSPAINMGDNTKSSALLTDFAGQVRINEGAVDLGAYENQSARITITSTLPSATRGLAYSQQFAATGGDGTYTYTVTYGKLPDGLMLSSSGVLSGKPIAAGKYTFNVMVNDGLICGNMLYQMEILPGSGNVRMYVNQASISGMDNGSDWANGFLDLQKALALSIAGDSIWVAKGTYSPGKLAGSRFVLKEGVKIFGGFAATESEFQDRDSVKIHTDNETILSGSTGAASYHVIYNVAALTQNTILDGFTIRGARAASTSNTTSANYVGGGIYNANVNGNPLLRNLHIKDNRAVNGGGMYNTGSPSLYKVKFSDNWTSSAYGGGLYNTGNPILTEVEFNANRAASYGGGLYSARGTLRMEKVSFIANTTPTRGGGMYATGTLNFKEVLFKDNRVSGNQYGGGLFIAAGSNSVLENVSFIGNSSGYSGGGLYNAGAASLKNVIFSRNSVRYAGGVYGGGMYTTTGPVTMSHVTFSNNTIAYVNSSTTASYGGALYRASGTVDVANSIFWNNKRGNNVADQINAALLVTNSLVEKGYQAGTNILNVDPQFTDAANDDLSLQSCSPAINVGENSRAAGLSFDRAMQPRVTHSIVDLGAYEYQGQTLENAEQALPDADQWKAYSHQVSVGTGTFSYSLVYGALPNGLVLAADGTLSGTPLEFGEFDFGLAVSGTDICGTLKVKLRVTEQVPYILQVYPASPLPIDVKLGTPFSQITLPAEIEVLLSDQTKTKLPVTWLQGSYNGNAVGKYEVTGTLTLPHPEMNPDNLTASVKISVFDPVTIYIVAVDTLSRVNVLAGTPFADLVLPAQVRVTYNDASTEVLNINWKQGGYLQSAGLYRLYGDLVLTDPESNPADFEASVDVYAQRNIVSVEVFDDREVALHTPAENLPLPIMAKVTYHDLTTDNLIVQWDRSTYLAGKAGVYSLPGILVLKNGTSNTSGLAANIKIVIMKDIVSVTESPAISVPYETAFADINFQEKVHVVFNDGTDGQIAVNWLEGNYKDDQEAVYTIHGELIPEEGIANTNDLSGKTMVTVLQRPKNIISVVAADSVSVAFGTPFTSLVPLLPAKLQVTYHDLTEEDLEINWLAGEYNPLLSESYTVYGDFKLPADAVNMDSIQAEVRVMVERRFITQVNPSDTFFTDYGTSFADLALPETVNVIYNDGTSGDEDVQWAEGTYQGDQDGTYLLAGTLVPGQEVDNINDLEAKINVVVAKRPPLIISVDALDTVYVNYGTLFADAVLTFPTHADALLDDATTVSLPLTWEEGNYMGDVSGFYQIAGKFILPSNLSNPNDLGGILVVRVDQQYITAISNPDTITVSYGTSTENLPLPTDIRANFNDGSTGAIGVEWDFSTYNAHAPGLYTLVGNLLVPGDIDNPDSLKAFVQIRVLAPRKTLMSVRIDSVSVDYGTLFQNITKPQTAIGIFDDLSESPLNVISWDSGSFDPLKAEDYQVFGLLQIPDTVENPDSLSAVLHISVDQKYIISVNTISEIEVDFGTAYEQLSLPGIVQVSYNDLSTGTAELSWQPGTYNGAIAGEYILSADLIPDSTVANRDSLHASVKVRVLNKLRVLSSIDSATILVEFGTPFSSIGLPAVKEGVFDDASKANLPLLWQEESYQSDSAGTRTVYADVKALPPDAENPNDIRAAAIVTISNKYISSIIQPDTISVPYGTPYAELPLPLQIFATFNDDTTGWLPAEWLEGTYIGETGTYRLEGSLVIDSDVDNPNDLAPSIVVLVESLIPDVDSVGSVTDIEVPFGTSLPQVRAALPVTVTVIYNNALEDELSLTWTSENFDETVAGTYDFNGALQLKPATTNLGEKTASVKVTVAKKNIVSVTLSSGLQDIYGTDFSNLDLPEKVEVTFNDGSVDELAVIWDEAGYNSNATGSQQLTGTIVLPADISNISDLKASILLNLSKAITAVETLAKRSVIYGAAYETLALPSNILVTYNDLSTESLALKWDSSEYTDATAGTIIMQAALPLPAGAVNPDNIIASVEIEIKKADLIITAEHKIRNHAEANPTLTFTYEGFVNSETESNLLSTPVISTSATINSESGEYPIEIQGATAANYNISFINGILHVVSLPVEPLPSAGPLSVFRIADYMLNLSEIDSAARNAPFTIALLNAKSRIYNKDAPFKVSDWYGYGPLALRAKLVTNGIRNIAATTASTGGYIHTDGGTPVIERGLCWSTQTEPTVADTKMTSGSGTGQFNTTMSGLAPNTTYYVRAYATDSEGTIYGNELIFTTKP